MVDLIPADYRRSQRVQRQLRSLGWTCLGLLVALGLGAAGLAHYLDKERAALARFKHLQAQAHAQQNRLNELKTQRDLASRHVQALDTLRGSASVGRLFSAVDAALNGRIWFQELAYSRANETFGQPTAAGTPATVAPNGNRGAATPAAGARPLREQADIRGVALDHAALAEFIRQLAARPGVNEVRLLDTRARNYPNLQVVDFQVATLFEVAAGAAPAAARASTALPLAALGTAR